MLPTLLAAAGEPDVKESCCKGMQVGDKTFKVHLDGYDLPPCWRARRRGPRHEFFYWNDDGQLVGAALRPVEARLRRAAGARLGSLAGAVHAVAGAQDLQPALRPVRDRRPRGDGLNRWRVEHVFLLVPAQQYVAQFIGTFKEFPPSQRVGSFSLDAVLQALQTPARNAD